MADGDNVRFGVSALDLEYADMAEKDELLVRSTDGQILYKRLSDGHIVEPTSYIYNRDALVSALERRLNGDALIVDPNDFVVYHSIGIAGNNNIESTAEVSFGVSKRFNISLDAPRMFVRVRANEITTAIMSLVERYSLTHEGPGYMCRLTVRVRETDSTGTVSTRTETMEVKFDELTMVRLTPSVSDVAILEVTPLTVQFPYYNEAVANLSDELKAEIRNLNYGNANLEADSVDFITIANDISDTVIFDNLTHTKLNYVLLMSELVFDHVDPPEPEPPEPEPEPGPDPEPDPDNPDSGDDTPDSDDDGPGGTDG